jgi:hypothetical protein
MKHYSILALFFWALAVRGQNSPELRSNDSNLEGFIPQGWITMADARGDLNGDGQEDVAIVIADTNENNYLPNTALGPTTLNTNPRSLLIFFNEKGTYRLVAKNEALIEPANNVEVPCLDDPFIEINFIIQNGVLTIPHHYFYSCGTYSVTNKTYKIKYINNAFVLIGYDVEEFSRATGEDEIMSINFITRKKSISTGTNEFYPEKNNPKTTWFTIKIKKLLTLEDLDRDTEINY